MQIVPFEQRFTEPAADLLAMIHLDSTPDQLNAWSGQGPAVAALDDDGALLGFLAATLRDVTGASAARTRIHQHAALGGDTRETYRRLYRALSERLAAIGCFGHTVTVTADRPEVLNSFVELGFGFDQIKGLRSVTPPDGVADVALRAAVAADLPRIIELTWELTRFHAEAPMLRPALADLRALRDNLSAGITDENRLVLVAEHDGGVAGLMVVDPDGPVPAAAWIGVAVVTAAVRRRALGTALLSGAAAWAAARGFQRLCVGWTSANLVSDAFWRGHGFVPVLYDLTRRIDPRVAWADARLDHRDLFPDL